MWFQTEFNEYSCPQLIQANAGMGKRSQPLQYQYFNSILSINWIYTKKSRQKTNRRRQNRSCIFAILITVCGVCVVRKRYVSCVRCYSFAPTYDRKSNLRDMEYFQPRKRQKITMKKRIVCSSFSICLKTVVVSFLNEMITRWEIPPTGQQKFIN